VAAPPRARPGRLAEDLAERCQRGRRCPERDPEPGAAGREFRRPLPPERRDGRYALHSETCPPPRQDDGFAIAGRAREVTDAGTVGVVRSQVLAERGGKVWPGFEEEAVFELGIERCLLMLTKADDPFPAGPTVWKAGGPAGAESAAHSDIVT
jgi:hypothetical protein